MISRPRLATLLLFIGSIAFALLLAELYLRATDFSYYWGIYKRPDPVLGWSPPPRVEAWQTTEGKALVHINSAGLRDFEHPRAKPPGTLRIAVLGDSFTEAVQVPLAATWWFLTQQRLRTECSALGGDAQPAGGPAGDDESALAAGQGEPESKVEVLSFGLSGYSTAQELLMLRQRVWDYQPDLVLLAFFHGNDLVENSPALDTEPLRPYFRLQDGKLQWDDGFLEAEEYRSRTSWFGRLKYALVLHSRLAQAVVRVVDQYRIAHAPRPEQGPGIPTEPGVDVRVYQPPRDADWTNAWEVTEAMVGQMYKEAQAHGARFAVVTLTTGAQVQPDPGFRAWFAEALGVEDLFYPGRRMGALGAKEGFPVFRLAPRLQAFATRKKLFLHGFSNSMPGAGHWNVIGHQAAAALLAPALCEYLQGTVHRQ